MKNVFYIKLIRLLDIAVISLKVHFNVYFWCKFPIMCVLTLNNRGKNEKNIKCNCYLLGISSLSYAGGLWAMSSAKSSSGVHFYGQLYVGYDDTSTGKAADSKDLDDGGGKSRLGLKMTESLGNGLQLIGNLRI
jgi:hypothetical protein